MQGYYYRHHNTKTWYFLPFDRAVDWYYLRAIILSYDERPQLRFSCSSGTLRYVYDAVCGPVWDRSRPPLAAEEVVPLGSFLTVAVSPSTQLPYGDDAPYAVTEDERFLEQVLVRPIREDLWFLWDHPDSLRQILRAPYFHRDCLRPLRTLPRTEQQHWARLKRLHPRLVAHWISEVPQRSA